MHWQESLSGSVGALARALPSVQVTWRLQAVPGTPSVPGTQELVQSCPTRPAPAWPTLCLQGPSRLPAPAGTLAGSFPASVHSRHIPAVIKCVPAVPAFRWQLEIQERERVGARRRLEPTLSVRSQDDDGCHCCTYSPYCRMNLTASLQSWRGLHAHLIDK